MVHVTLLKTLQIPVNIVSGKRSFSKLKLMKTPFDITITQMSFSLLTILYIE